LFINGRVFHSGTVLGKKRTCNSQWMLGSEKTCDLIETGDGNGRYSDGIV